MANFHSLFCVRYLYFIFLAILLALPGTARADFDHAGLATQVLERHIRPGYEKLLQAARSFEADAHAFCNAGAGEDISAVKTAFGDLVLAWSRIEHLRFGPAQEKRRHARMFYWPDRKGLGRKQIAKATSKRAADVLDPIVLSKKSVAVQGLGALEYLLYRSGTEDFAIEGEARDHRCGYMTSVAANIERISENIRAEWAPGARFSELFLAPGPNNETYLEPSEITLEISKTFLVGLERLRDVKIVGPLGMRRNNSRRTRAAFEPSKLSTRVLAANLAGLIDLFVEGGLLERIEQHEPGMGKAIMFELKQSLAILDGIKIQMKLAVNEPVTEDKLFDLGFPLKNVRIQTGRILAEAAGLNLGFNALDGD